MPSEQNRDNADDQTGTGFLGNGPSLPFHPHVLEQFQIYVQNMEYGSSYETHDSLYDHGPSSPSLAQYIVDNLGTASEVFSPFSSLNEASPDTSSLVNWDEILNGIDLNGIDSEGDSDNVNWNDDTFSAFLSSIGFGDGPLTPSTSADSPDTLPSPVSPSSMSHSEWPTTPEMNQDNSSPTLGGSSDFDMPPKWCVGTEASDKAAEGRRKKDPRFKCDVPGCNGKFTEKHNLLSMFFLIQLWVVHRVHDY
ncbi:hypothetical protein VKT23_003472 [Stygiomarasmius scandens]|uniref:C2H2-type domain-containing protein n=1 Tax=Marasmiellus scandens TaxID=2682957 RepID=A0ABR1JXB7_9AGAR